MRSGFGVALGALGVAAAGCASLLGIESVDYTPADGAAPSGTIVPLARGTSASLVAIDDAYVYWWSAERHTIYRGTRQDPSAVDPLIVRAGQTASGLMVDESGVYWIEQGLDDEGGTTSRVMTRAGDGGIRELIRSPVQLSRLALRPLDVLALEAPGDWIWDASKQGGTATRSGFGIDGTGSFVSDGTDVFYMFGYDDNKCICVIGRPGVVGGLNRPRGLIVDATRLYWIAPEAATVSILSVPKDSRDAPADAAIPLVTGQANTVALAVQGSDLIWANLGDDTIVRGPKSGAGPTAIIASDAGGPNAIAADSRGVYWTSDLGVSWAVP
jgi:hypothetical protein